MLVDQSTSRPTASRPSEDFAGRWETMPRLPQRYGLTRLLEALGGHLGRRPEPVHDELVEVLCSMINRIPLEQRDYFARVWPD